MKNMIDCALDLAREISILQGHPVPMGYKFYESKNSREIAIWNITVLAFKRIAEIDLEAS